MTENNSTKSVRNRVTPDLLWSKYSIIQHVVFWVIALGIWWGLHYLARTREAWTIPLWQYLSRIRFYFFTGDFNHAAVRGILIGAAILFAITGFDWLVAKLKGDPPVTQILRNHYLLPRTPKQRFIAVVLGVNAGIFEELFFRGGVFFLLLLLTRSAIFSIVVTSAVFALLHTSVQGWYSTVLIFLVGIVLNLLLLLTDSFYAPIFCHITINLGNILVIPSFFEEHLPEIQKASAPSESSSLES